MVKYLVEAILPLFKISGGFAKILHLFLLLAVLTFLVLVLRFSRRVFEVNDFWSCACNPSMAIA
jgi:uncharacterized membrane protein